MLFVTESFELKPNMVVALTVFYPETMITNTGNQVANLLKSSDGVNWLPLVTIPPNGNTTLTLDDSSTYIQFKEDTTVYFKSKTPSYQHTQTKGTTGNVDTSAIVSQVQQSVSSDIKSIKDNIKSLEYDLSQENEQNIRLYGSLEDKILNVFSTDNLNRLTPQQIQVLRNKLNVVPNSTYNADLKDVREVIAELQNNPNTPVDLSGLTDRMVNLESKVNVQINARIDTLNQTMSAFDTGLREQRTQLDTLLASGSPIKEYQSGTLNTTSPASSGEGNSRQWDIVFDKPFSKPPVIAYSVSTTHNRFHYIKNVTATGFTYMANYVDYNADVSWVAFVVD